MHGTRFYEGLAIPKTKIDTECLSYGVGWAETNYCTNPNAITAKARSNCWGIMTWRRGHRELITFESIESGSDYFADLWIRKYGDRLPTLADAKKWTAESNYEDWHSIVHHRYNKCLGEKSIDIR